MLFTGEFKMKLKEWLKYNGHSYRSVALLLDTSFRNVERWARGERLPRWHEADKIFNLTKNEVTGHDLYEQQIQRKKAGL